MDPTAISRLLDRVAAIAQPDKFRQWSSLLRLVDHYEVCEEDSREEMILAVLDVVEAGMTKSNTKDRKRLRMLESVLDTLKPNTQKWSLDEDWLDTVILSEADRADLRPKKIARRVPIVVHDDGPDISPVRRKFEFTPKQYFIDNKFLAVAQHTTPVHPRRENYAQLNRWIQTLPTEYRDHFRVVQLDDFNMNFMIPDVNVLTEVLGLPRESIQIRAVGTGTFLRFIDVWGGMVSPLNGRTASGRHSHTEAHGPHAQNRKEGTIDLDSNGAGAEEEMDETL